MGKPKRHTADRKAEDCINRAIAWVNDAVYHSAVGDPLKVAPLQRLRDTVRAGRDTLWPAEGSDDE